MSAAKGAAAPAASTAVQVESAAPAPPADENPLQKGYRKFLELDQLKKSKAAFFAAFACAGLFFVILIVHLATVTTKATTARLTVIPFTDGQPDDLFALNYLAHRSDVRVPFVVAVTNSLASSTAAYRNVKRFYKLMSNSPNAPKIPEVLIGAPLATADSLTHNCTYSRVINPTERVKLDLLYGAGVDLRAATRRTAAEIFADARGVKQGQNTVKQPEYFLPRLRSFLGGQGDRTVVLLALAPVTDIAAVLNDAATPKQKISRVVISGGVVRVQGDVFTRTFLGTNQVAESNLFLDPDAAKRIFARRSDDPDVLLVPTGAATSVPYTLSWTDLTQPPASKSPVDKWLAGVLLKLKAALGDSSASWFEKTYVPRDLVAATIVSSPRVRGGSTAVVDRLGVSVDQTNLGANGQVGKVADAAIGTASVTKTVDVGSFWTDYLSITQAPWPK
jgi:inosine-uridine nucleoside N-ribohydrolase